MASMAPFVSLVLMKATTQCQCFLMEWERRKGLCAINLTFCKAAE